MYQATDPITSEAELMEMTEEMHPSQVNKIVDRIDAHLAAWIERTTFVSIGSCDAKGNMDVSPKGDPAGFIKVLDDKTLMVPERIGNHRRDTFLNVLENPRIGMMLVVPKRKEVVRDPGLLDLGVMNGHRPDLALLVRVEEAFFHCGKAMIRSGMWQPNKWGSIEGLPTYSQALKDHGDMEMPLKTIEERMAYNESDRLY